MTRRTRRARVAVAGILLGAGGAAAAVAAPTTTAALRAAASGMPWWSAAEVAAVTSLGLATLGPPPPDPSNRVADDPRAAAFGARLFADPRLSATGAVSCASCHQPARGFQDGRALGRGVGTGTRRTMSVVGAAYTPWLFWDGRADSPWAQALGPLENAAEHGGTRALYVRVLARYYGPPYAALFGPLPDTLGLPGDAGPLGTAAARRAWAALPAARRDSVTRAFANLGKTVAAYERTLRYPETRFDRYAAALAAGDRPRAGAILSADEAAGLRLFVGRARCATCHTGPRFTDDAFHNTGVPAAPGLPADDGRLAGAAAVRADPFNCLGAYSDAYRDVPRAERAHAAAGTAADAAVADGAGGSPAACAELRFLAREDSAFRGAYRPPSLRGVAERAPYMHAGQFATLRAVLAHYNAAPPAARGRSELHPLGLTRRELSQLAQFLGTLSPETVHPGLAPPGATRAAFASASAGPASAGPAPAGPSPRTTIPHRADRAPAHPMRDIHGLALAAPVLVPVLALWCFARAARTAAARRAGGGGAALVAALVATPLLLGVPAASRGQTSTASPPAGSPPAGAELPPVARQVYEGTMSPFCPELLLANCPSPQADSLRRAIAARAAAGETREHLVADLLATYGDVVRAAPERRGFGLVAWVVPGLLLVTAGGWVTWWSRRSAQASTPTPPAVRAGRPAPARDERAHDGPARDGSLNGTLGGTATELAALDALLRRG